jgi:pimeloyl-CoA synthetase
MGSVVGTEGHWYDYLFIDNKSLTYAALNDLRNSGHKLGANIIYVDDDIGFATSVTFYGQAYRCHFKE